MYTCEGEEKVCTILCPLVLFIYIGDRKHLPADLFQSLKTAIDIYARLTVASNMSVS